MLRAQVDDSIEGIVVTASLAQDIGAADMRTCDVREDVVNAAKLLTGEDLVESAGYLLHGLRAPVGVEVPYEDDGIALDSIFDDDIHQFPCSLWSAPISARVQWQRPMV